MTLVMAGAWDEAGMGARSGLVVLRWQLAGVIAPPRIHLLALAVSTRQRCLCEISSPPSAPLPRSPPCLSPGITVAQVLGAPLATGFLAMNVRRRACAVALRREVVLLHHTAAVAAAAAAAAPSSHTGSC